MTEKPPADPADHAEDFAHRWRDKLEEYRAVRMEELGIPNDLIGQPDYDGDGSWQAFDPNGRKGGPAGKEEIRFRRALPRRRGLIASYQADSFAQPLSTHSNRLFQPQ